MNDVVNKDYGKNIYHIVLAEDVVPAALFKDFAYQNLPTVVTKQILKDQIIEKLSGVNKKRAEEIAAIVGTLENPTNDNLVYDHSDDSTYAPIGHYIYIKKGKMYELRFNDPQYIGYALIPALNIIGELGSWELIRKWCNDTLHEMAVHEVVTKIKDYHGIQNYGSQLTGAGFI